MAVSTVISPREEFQFGLAIQSAWNTPNTTDAQYRKLDTTEPVLVDWSGVLAAENVRAGNGIVPHYTDRFRREAGMYPSFSVSGVLTSEEAHLLIMGVMQDIVSEAATQPYMRTHEWDEASRGLSGITPILFFTGGFYDPQSGVRERLMNCVLHTLELSADPGQQAGRIAFRADFTSFGAANRNATLVPGSWVAPGSTHLCWDQMTAYSLGGNDLNLLSWKLTLTNEATALPAQGGNASGVRFNRFMAKLELKALYDAVTKEMLGYWLANPLAGSAELRALLGYSTDTETNYHTLGIDMNAILDAVAAKDLGQAQGGIITIPLIGVNDGTNEALEITQTNNTDMIWT